MFSGVHRPKGSNRIQLMAGSKELRGELDRLRLTIASANLISGSIRIAYR
jgi:hypothetical protein